MKKPKRRRPTVRRKQASLPEMPVAPCVFVSESDGDAMLAGMMRARLALMPPQVADDYRNLTQRDDLTVAERTKVSVFEDTYAPSGQQIQAAIFEARAGIKTHRKAAR